MTRFATWLAAVASVGALAACGTATSSPVSKVKEPTPTSNSSATLSETRFQVLLHDTSDLLGKVVTAAGEKTPASAEEANALLEIDADSPLRFAELVTTGGARFCVASDDDTYVAMSEAEDTRLLMGDGECSYDESDALVIGDLTTGEWTKGAELMGKDRVLEIIPRAIRSSRGPEEHDVPEMSNPQLMNDASTLAWSLETYFADFQAYPSVPATGLVRTLSRTTAIQLDARTRVHAYLPGKDDFALCLVDDQGNWVRWSSVTGDMEDGTYRTAAELDRTCAKPPSADRLGVVNP